MGANAALLFIATAQAGATVASAYTSSRAIKDQGAFESQVAAQNAKLAKLQSDDALRRGELEAQNYQFQVKRLLGSQRARLAAQGLDLASGSAADVLEDTARFAAIDAVTIRNNAFREAMGYEIQSSEYRTQAAFAKITARNKAAQTILTGGLQAAYAGAGYVYQRQLSQIGAPTTPTSPTP